MTWKRVPLTDVGTWYGGATPSKSNASFWTDGTIPWLSPKDMGPEVLTSTQDHITRTAVERSSVRLVPGGSTAVVVRSGIIERTIPVSLVPFETTLNQDMKAVQPRADIDARWIAWALRAFERELLRDTRKAGTTVASIEWPRFQAFEIPVPPLDDQRRIIDLLEDHLSRLDAADTSARHGLRRMSALRKAHLREAFEPVAAEMRPLLDIASIANGQTPKGLVEILSSEPGDDGVPFFKVGDMNAADGRWMNAARFFVSRESAERIGLHVRPAGTVLIPKRGGAIATNKKRILASPAAYDLNTMGLVPADGLDSSYLWHWLQTLDLGRIADGSNVPQINATQIRELRLPVPDLDSQLDISRRLDNIDEGLTRIAVQVTSIRSTGRTLRRALLTAAFAGRLTGDVASALSESEEMVGA